MRPSSSPLASHLHRSHHHSSSIKLRKAGRSCIVSDEVGLLCIGEWVDPKPKLVNRHSVSAACKHSKHHFTVSSISSANQCGSSSSSSAAANWLWSSPPVAGEAPTLAGALIHHHHLLQVPACNRKRVATADGTLVDV